LSNDMTSVAKSASPPAEKSPLDVRGNTLRVFIHVLKNGPCELRDIQHALQLSSPSLAVYHLNRLVEAGYVMQDEYGRYLAVAGAAGKVLGEYTKVGPAVLPQLFFSTLLLTILAVFFAGEVLLYPSFPPYYIIGVLGCALVALWFETVKLWRRLG
jgi:hypothetical protein